MPKLRHIALSTDDTERLATFYKEVFGMTELDDPVMRERSTHGVIRLTDGYINLAIQKCRTADDPVPGTTGVGGIGIHHIGFEVEDLDQLHQKLERARSVHVLRHGPKDNLKRNEEKWLAPDGVVIDVSSVGWEVS